MARIRTIKPDFFIDEELAALPHIARLLFVGLWVHADREGRLEDRPARIRALVFPYEPRADVDGLLDQLAAERAGGRPGFIVRYSAGGRDLIQISAFLDHQRPNAREPQSTLPGPDEDGAHARTCKHVQADACTLGRGKGKGREREGERPLSGLGAAQPDRDRSPGAQADPTGPEPGSLSAPVRALSEMDWRVEEVWRAHLAQWRGFYEDSNGRIPLREPTLTDEIRTAIRAAIREYDGDLLGRDQRQRWTEQSKARAAGVGIFLDPWCTGTARDNDHRNGGKRYLEHWRPWVRQRGKPSPVDRFAELYFEARSLGAGAAVAPQPPAMTAEEDDHALVA